MKHVIVYSAGGERRSMDVYCTANAANVIAHALPEGRVAAREALTLGERHWIAAALIAVAECKKIAEAVR